MICQPCRLGADEVTRHGAQQEHTARALHAMCAGSRACDCQHKVEAQVAGKAVQR